jgi:spore coat protein A
MRFRVIPGPVTHRTVARELATDYRALVPEALAAAPRRVIALVEREFDNAPNMLTMRELAIADEDHTAARVTVVDGEHTVRYRAVAAHFEHTTTRSTSTSTRSRSSPGAGSAATSPTGGSQTWTLPPP